MLSRINVLVISGVSMCIRIRIRIRIVCYSIHGVLIVKIAKLQCRYFVFASTFGNKCCTILNESKKKRMKKEKQIREHKCFRHYGCRRNHNTPPSTTGTNEFACFHYQYTENRNRTN